MQTVRLPDADADAFTIYDKWHYTARFHLLGSFEGPRSPSPSLPLECSQGGQRDLHWDGLSTCYALSDFL
jgi:hypothetical protein